MSHRISIIFWQPPAALMNFCFAVSWQNNSYTRIYESMFSCCRQVKQDSFHVTNCCMLKILNQGECKMCHQKRFSHHSRRTILQCTKGLFLFRLCSSFHQCHIKARALRAAAQGPPIKKGPKTNFSCKILKLKPNFYFQMKRKCWRFSHNKKMGKDGNIEYRNIDGRKR